MDVSQRTRAILSFVHAADGGSFAAAGRMLGITSAAVSKNVAGLEQALGVRLMNRTTRTLKLTDEGSVFLRQARVALDALDSAVDSIVAQRLGPQGRVRISTSAAFGREHLQPVLPGLLARYPGLSVEADFDDRIVDVVRDGYDIVIRGGNVHDSALVSRPVFRMNTVLVASPAYLASHGIPRAPGDLVAHRLIARRFLGGEVATWSFRTRDGSIVAVDPVETALLTFSAPEAVLQAARDGLGIAQVGVHLAWAHLRAGALKVLLHRHHLPGSYEMAMQYPHRALKASRVQATVDYLLDAFAANESLHVPLKALDAYGA
ncbi:LysR family transcriptional regulator [Burkholderia contaminans]|uniref:LysR family transcriptional regulator n=1 Tax=Burkholderia contaminans TaxID=488447 RepID=A0A3N8RDG3_9BURK|nr:LysR family transcriptional regulator [Burkholderia contaminans]MCA7883711.1 LysR family transcriptional regulator [Burkholderia contaminans]MCA8154540.1 LysR family transcriptional regulator [Burkholderia contaminans]RQT08415.1 LysR family transcriptional regulator [Burkholderia contaminans]RQT29936.1 LysR family transcriptional regulator [Burkholderia contaminans]HEM7878881.1 LysR family transcriptional regulator [Burkholderia contaminans]